MAASLASFASILKEFYLGPIQDQLNEETLVCDIMEKASVDWNGRQVIIPVHVGRNTGVGWVAEGGVLPGQGGIAGVPAVALGAQPQQLYSNLTVTAQNLYGRFMITGPAMAAAGKGGANSFVGWVDAEMNRLVNDVKNNCNRSAVSGGDCIGFCLAQANGVAVAPGVNIAYVFNGDNVKAAAAALDATVNGFDLVRTDTYAVIDQVTVTAVVPGTISMTPSGATVYPTDPAGASIPLALIANTVGAAGVNYALGNTAAEPIGIYGNLGLPGAATGGFANFNGAWFGPDRTTATGAALGTNTLGCTDASTGPAAPTSNLLSQNVATPPAPVAVSLAVIQQGLDRIALASEDTPDVILCNPLQRTRLAAMLQGVMGVGAAGANVFDVKSRPTTGDGGFTGFAFAGIPVKTSRHVDNGLMLLLSTKTWKMLELESGKFADADGNTLSRIPGADAFEGFYKWYYNIVCVRPNANGAIVGLTL
tara:strand:- start:3748 stop:5184 length:1437 start_codon:yes stop_codon:yes gene_type:complete